MIFFCHVTKFGQSHTRERVSGRLLLSNASSSPPPPLLGIWHPFSVRGDGGGGIKCLCPPPPPPSPSGRRSTNPPSLSKTPFLLPPLEKGKKFFLVFPFVSGKYTVRRGNICKTFYFWTFCRVFHFPITGFFLLRGMPNDPAEWEWCREIWPRRSPAGRQAGFRNCPLTRHKTFFVLSPEWPRWRRRRCDHLEKIPIRRKDCVNQPPVRKKGILWSWSAILFSTQSVRLENLRLVFKTK